MKSRPIVNRCIAIRAASLVLLIAALTITSAQISADTGTCNGSSVTLPFTDVPAANVFFCSIAEAFFAGLTNGTTATTYSPSANVPREQMAAFVTRTLDQSLRRGSQRAAMKRFWIPNNYINDLTLTGAEPRMCECDGEDVWVANNGADTVSRVRASDGKLLGTWTGVSQAFGLVIINSHIYVTGRTGPFVPKIYVIDAEAPPGAVSVLSSTLGNSPGGIAFDGFDLWTANAASVSRVNPISGDTINITNGFSSPRGILFDGTNIWVTDSGDDTLKKLNVQGAILQTVPVGDGPGYPVYDGVNIWVPNQTANSITVVRASTGQVIATIPTGTIPEPQSAAFDGERILVVGNLGGVAIYKAADLTLIKTQSTDGAGFGTCSDGIKFFFTVPVSAGLAAF